MASITQIALIIMIALFLVEESLCRPMTTAEEVIKAEIKEETQKLRILKELLSEVSNFLLFRGRRQFSC